MKIKDISQERLAQLNLGQAETKNLAEFLAINLHVLLSNSIPQISTKSLKLIEENKNQGITKRMEQTGTILFNESGLKFIDELINHPSDMVRSVACYMIAAQNNIELEKLFTQIKPLADDSHFGVREWAWLALRPIVAKNIVNSVELLSSWCLTPSPYLRRFASEITRPRGVWCAHILKLKTEPSIGLPILELLKNDNHKYVQDSVGNWLNDAAKTQANWVIELIAKWKSDKYNMVNERIVKLALRTIRKNQL